MTNQQERKCRNKTIKQGLVNRCLLRLEYQLQHPILCTTLATDKKLPLSHLHISYQNLKISLQKMGLILVNKCFWQIILTNFLMILFDKFFWRFFLKIFLMNFLTNIFWRIFLTILLDEFFRRIFWRIFLTIFLWLFWQFFWRIFDDFFY